MKTYISSDLHLSHGNIMLFNPLTRKKYLECVGDPDQLLIDIPLLEKHDRYKILGKAADYMNEQIVTEWNQTVNTRDLVYILGDVAFCSAKHATELLSQMNGRKILVVGNHDAALIKHKEFHDQFEQVESYLEVKHNGANICMSHYPFASWNRRHHGAIMFHGHLHGTPSGINGRILDVGFDATTNLVSNLDSIVDQMMTIDIGYKHHDVENRPTEM